MLCSCSNLSKTNDIETESQLLISTELNSNDKSQIENISTETESDEILVSNYTYTDLDLTMYTLCSINVREMPVAESAKLGSLEIATAVHVIGQCNETNWYCIEFNGTTAYVHNDLLSTETPSSHTDNENTGDDNSDNTYYDPADENKDGVVDAEEELGYITPEKQACIDAGYGVVVEFGGGSWYAVLTPSGRTPINGMLGCEILDAYLAERGLQGHTSGSWINPDKGWYWFIADNIRPL